MILSPNKWRLIFFLSCLVLASTPKLFSVLSIVLIFSFVAIPTLLHREGQTHIYRLLGRTNTKTLLCAYYFYYFLNQDVFSLHITRLHSRSGDLNIIGKIWPHHFSLVCILALLGQMIKFRTIFLNSRAFLATWRRLSNLSQALKFIPGSYLVTYTQLTKCLWVQFLIQSFKFCPIQIIVMWGVSVV